MSFVIYGTKVNNGIAENRWGKRKNRLIEEFDGDTDYEALAQRAYENYGDKWLEETSTDTEEQYYD